MADTCGFLGIYISPLCATDKNVYAEYLRLCEKALEHATFDDIVANGGSRGEGLVCCGETELGALGGDRGGNGVARTLGPVGTRPGGMEPVGSEAGFELGESGRQGSPAVLPEKLERRDGGVASAVGNESWRLSSGVAAGSAGGGRGAVRGPNYARNQAARMKKRIKKQAAQEAQQRGFFSSCSDEVRERLRDSRAQLLILENERRAVEERRRLEKLKSPVAIVKDAMELVNLANKYAKSANDSKVAGWAQTLAESYAESVARSAPSNVPSLESVASARSLRLRQEERRAELSLDSTFPNAVETKALGLGLLSRAKLYDARCKAMRELRFEDFTAPGAPFKLSRSAERALRNADYDSRDDVEEFC